jgi:hypothetical protein
MKKVEINGWDGVKIHCPFCGALAWSEEGMTSCPHTLYHAGDEGFEMVHNLLNLEEEYEDQDDLSLDEFTDEMDVPNAVKFAIYQGAPGFFGAYTAFAMNVLPVD